MTNIQIQSLTDSKGKVLENLISDNGTGNVKEIVEFIRSDGYLNTKKQFKQVLLHINQLRKFYDSFLKVVNNNAEEKEKKIQLLMIKANAEYAAKRLRTNRFKDFLSNRIDLVVKQNDTNFQNNLRALKLHFEALVAYYPKN
ncbi:MAG: type III-A CRISPR-associated protein Csm2 [Ignavibacteriaceae bacterium]|nr:type III-A CRISPR-associated protein Csm2 [Ignavibacteriaceae bacterium]